MAHFLRGVFLVFILSSVSVYGQNGTVNGTIVDTTGAPAPFVKIVALGPVGTTYGAQSGIDGKYELSLPAGSYQIVCRAVGQVCDTLNLSIASGEKIIHNCTLRTRSDILDVVTITVIKDRGTENSGIGETKEADGVITTIGSEEIKKTQVSDGTDVVRRMPGVTIVGGNYIMVRGLDARYNNVMLHDVFAPSMETDVKSFSFDIIPAGMIDRIVMYKSPQADVTGEFAGGVVKIYTKGIPDSTYSSISMSTTYRSGSSFRTFLQPARGPWHWTGFNDGYNDLPDGFTANVNTFQPNGERTLSSVGQSLKNNWTPDQTNSVLDKSFSFTHGHKMTWGKVEVGNITSITYNNARTIYNSERNDYNAYDHIGDKSAYIYSFNDQQFNQTIRTGVIHNWAFKFSEEHSIEFKNLFTVFSTTQYVNRTGYDYEFNYAPNNHSFNQVYRGLYSGQLLGKHLYNEERTTVNWTVGYGYSYRDQPDYRRYRSDVDTLTGETQLFVGVPVSPNYLGRFYSELRENSQALSFAVEHKFKENKMNPIFKTGVYFERKDRNFKARNLGYVQSNFMTFDQSLTFSTVDSLFNPDNINSTTGIKIAESTNPSDSYTASSYLSAAYATIELELAKKIKLNTGVRTEYNIQQLNSKTIGGTAVNVNNMNLNVLPSINIAYTLKDTGIKTMLIRLAYGTTVNRPEFRELAPFSFYDFNYNLVKKGSDSLLTPVIHNFDLRWELYPNIGEMITFGLFYKQFQNPIETLFIPGGGSGGIKTFTYGNAKMATSMGMEVEIRKSLRGITIDTSFLDNFSLIINASLIKSHVVLGQSQLGQSNERPMQGQSPYIINAGIFYESPKHNYSFNILYNVIGQRIFIIGFDVYPDIYEMPRNVLDFNFSKKFANNLELKLNVGDILNQKYTLLQDANADKKFDRNNDQIIQGYKPGRTIQIGFSYRF